MTDLRALELDPGYDVVDFLPPELDADLTNCDREPIHLSGAIQPHGVLLAVHEGTLRIRQVTANSAAHLGVTPSVLLGSHLSAAIGAEPVERLQLALGATRAAGSDPLLCHLPSGAAYELTWHRTGGLLLLELEPADVPGSVSMSVLFADVRHAMQSLQDTEGVTSLCQVAATEFQRMTGYDRVMVYRFADDEHGEIVAEQRQPGMEPFLGLHYPASDIPRQARKLYLLNHLRVIADVDYEPVPLLAVGGTDAPMDLSLAGLRSVSPYHLQYLANMDVQATLTISLMHGTRLWGMLACHHRTPKRIDAQLRAACRMLGQVFSLQVVAQESRERRAYRSRLARLESVLMGEMSTASSLAGALAAMKPSPLALTGADGMVARIDGTTVQAGLVPPPEAVRTLLAGLRAEELPSTLVSDRLSHRFPELAPYAEHAAGVLALPLSAVYEDFVLWFRGELLHTVSWGGEPDHKALGEATGVPAGPLPEDLGPRTSFDAWTQEVRGRSRPWLAAEVETAHALAAAVPDLLLGRTRDRLNHLSRHDALTSLPNRALLLELTRQALDSADGDGHVALLFIDLDRFKAVNDKLGHAAGDSLLRQTADRLAALGGVDGTVARVGSDEFSLLCPGTTVEKAEALAERVVQAFRTPFLLDGQEALVTTSVGVAVSHAGTTPVELLRDADTAMYRAKHSGRDGVSPFTAEMRAVTMPVEQMQLELPDVLARGGLQVHYQPVHHLVTGLVGFEALARWPLPGHGMVPPEDFVPVAERLGLSPDVTRAVLQDGLRELSAWRRQRPDLDLVLTVNVTGSDLAGDALEGDVHDGLRDNGLPGSALALDVSEDALPSEDQRARDLAGRLQEQGVRLSIDDFGTGFSSLTLLTRLPITQLKIDRTFIAGLPAKHSDVTAVASVVGLAHQLGMLAVAEGVETDEQLAAVRRLGCDSAQGYLLGSPMPATEVERYLAGLPGPQAPRPSG